MVSKVWRQGTHRIVPPQTTLERVLPLLPAFGITRIANVTGLDHIGLPVVVVCRPNSRSLSVSQGKGLTMAAAKASGVMESIECFHAERLCNPLRLSSYAELSMTEAVADPMRLPRLSVSRYHERGRILWVEGFDLMRSVASWVPHELVHLDLTLPLPEGSGCFPLGSNGLASGNDLGEATNHAICELIERDGTALFTARGGESSARGRIDPNSVTGPACRDLLERFERAGMLVAAWDLTTDVGVATFRATILERETDPNRPLYPGRGTGCHPDREVALLRALTEAAQSRLTRISSSRDDVPRADYELTRNPDLLAQVRTSMEVPARTRSFTDIPTADGASFEQDLAYLLERLRGVGIEQVVRVDLSRPGLPISVVRAVIPGLEGKPGGPGWRPGPRYRAAHAAVGPAS